MSQNVKQFMAYFIVLANFITQSQYSSGEQSAFHENSNDIFMRRSRAGTGFGSPTLPLKNKKKISFFFQQLWSGPLKITKLPGQFFVFCQNWHARETPFKWCFADGPMMAHLEWYLDPFSPHKKQTKPSKLDHLLQNFLDPVGQVVLGR